MRSSSVWRRGAAILECRFKKPSRSDDMTKVAAVILGRNTSEVEGQSRIALAKGADLVEIRFDEIADLGPDTIRHLAKAVGEHAIATLRSSVQGGAQRRGRAPRSALMKEICVQRFAYIDLELEEDEAELDDLARVAHHNSAKVIVSHHFAGAVDVHQASRSGIRRPIPAQDLDRPLKLPEFARIPARVRMVTTGPLAVRSFDRSPRRPASTESRRMHANVLEAENSEGCVDPFRLQVTLS